MIITDNELERIESAFKFKLYDWQREYIKGNSNFLVVGRCNGKTFTHCVRLLLEDRPAIKLSDIRNGLHLDEWHGTNYIRWFSDYIVHIDYTLRLAGFDTNLINDRKGNKH